MKELVTYIARSLVDKPEQVTVAEVEGNQTTVLELTVAKRGPWKGYRQAGQDRPGHANHFKRRIIKSEEAHCP